MIRDLRSEVEGKLVKMPKDKTPEEVMTEELKRIAGEVQKLRDERKVLDRKLRREIKEEMESYRRGTGEMKQIAGEVRKWRTEVKELDIKAKRKMEEEMEFLRGEFDKKLKEEMESCTREIEGL